MIVQVCWYNEDVTPKDLIKVLGPIGRDGFLVEPMSRTKPAKTFDERNHRWVIECSGNFTEAVKLTQDFLAVLWRKFQIRGYRILIEDDNLRLEDPSVASRLMNRVDMLESVIQEEIGKLKKSRRIAGNQAFQSIREELERVLFADPHSWRPPCR